MGCYNSGLLFPPTILNILLDNNRSSFRYSTDISLLFITEALRLVSAAARSSLLILLDLSEAFSIVNHLILLSTLWTMGIITLVWVLTYRYMFYGFLEENHVTSIIHRAYHRVRCSAPSSSQYIQHPLGLSLPLQCQQHAAQLLSFFLSFFLSIYLYSTNKTAEPEPILG